MLLDVISAPGILGVFLWMAGLMLGILMVLGVSRVVSRWRAIRVKRIKEELRFQVGRMAGGEDPEALKSLRWPPGSVQWTAVYELLIDHLARAPGREKREVTKAFESLGYVEYYTRHLALGGARLRIAAACRLGCMESSQAVPALVAAMAQSDRAVRHSAVEALGRIRDPQALKALVEAVRAVARSGGDLSQRHLLAAILPFGVAAVLPLTILLRDPSDRVRSAAIDFLSEIPNRKALGPLVKALRDPSPRVRARAASALGKIGHPLSVRPLLPLLLDPFWYVRMQAIRSLGRLASPQAVHPLTLCLMDPHAQIRQVAAEALNRLGSVAANAMAAYLLYSRDRFAREQVSAVLQESGFVRERIDHLISDDPKSREEAFNLLLAVGRIGSLHDFKKTLQTHPDVRIRLILVDLLEKSGRNLAWRIIRWVSLYDPDPAVRERAKSATLKIIRNPKGQDGLAFCWQEPRAF